MSHTYIISSAVKYKETIIGGRRHGDCFKVLIDLLPEAIYKAIQAQDLVCGFIDNYGKFYNREAAYPIAEKAGQLKFGKCSDTSTLRINFANDTISNSKKLLISEFLFNDLKETTDE